MLELKSYDKYEIAAELNIDAKKTCNITRKLTSLGYRFSTSGRGDTYTITILEMPKEGIKEFAQKYLNITTYKIEQLAHYLNLLTLETQPQAATDIRLNFYESNIANMPSRCLEWIVPVSHPTINTWINGLIKAGLLIKEECVDTYYATYRDFAVDENSEDAADYLWTRRYAVITREEFEKAAKAYNDYYNDYMKDYDTNWKKIDEEGKYLASREKLEAINKKEKWWAILQTHTISLNKAWPHYDELIELLKNYSFEPYEKWEHGNYDDDEKERIEREERWKRLKEERRVEMLGEEEAKAEIQEEAKVQEEIKKAFKPVKDIIENTNIEVYIDEPYKNAVFDSFDEWREAFLQYVHKV